MGHSDVLKKVRCRCHLVRSSICLEKEKRRVQVRDSIFFFFKLLSFVRASVAAYLLECAYGTSVRVRQRNMMNARNVVRKAERAHLRITPSVRALYREKPIIVTKTYGKLKVRKRSRRKLFLILLPFLTCRLRKEWCYFGRRQGPVVLLRVVSHSLNQSAPAEGVG